MSDRGTFRGRGGRGGGFDRGGGRGAHSTQHRGGGASSGGAAAPQQEKPKKENILDLSKYMDKEVNVKFNGGREGQSGLSFHFFCCFRFKFWSCVHRWK
jgi:U6 snRNA-associated Sm-like protein LSm7